MNEKWDVNDDSDIKMEDAVDKQFYFLIKISSVVFLKTFQAAGVPNVLLSIKVLYYITSYKGHIFCSRKLNFESQVMVL